MRNLSRLICSNLIGLFLLSFLLAGCGGKEYVRSSDDPDIDYYAMSLRFDKRDINNLYDQIIDELLSANIVDKWKNTAQEGDPPVVAILPMKNETSEHIESQLQTILSKFETDLVNKTAAEVVSKERQKQLISEIKSQQSDAYDSDRTATYGKQLGAQYVLTGKVRDAAERAYDQKRVQYFMFVQIIDVRTGTITFQKEASVTKALK